jgi:hypothetical protein
MLRRDKSFVSHQTLTECEEPTMGWQVFRLKPGLQPQAPAERQVFSRAATLASIAHGPIQSGEIMPYQWDTEFGVKQLLHDAVGGDGHADDE